MCISQLETTAKDADSDKDIYLADDDPDERFLIKDAIPQISEDINIIELFLR